MDRLPSDSYGGEVRTDDTNNILFLAYGTTARTVRPLRVRSGHLVDLPGFGDAGRISGDNESTFARRGGLLDLVMHQHTNTGTGLSTATITWRWDGHTYVEGPCIDDSTDRRGGPACR